MRIAAGNSMSLDQPAGQGSSDVPWRRHLWHALLGLLTALAFTPAVIAVHVTLDVNDASIVYLIPVVIAANRYGMTSALTAALSGTATSAFFIYHPIYSLRVLNPQDVMALMIFTTVAAITSHLSSVARSTAAIAEQRTRELEMLYAFSRRLSAASAPEEIFAAIQEHVTTLLGGKVSILRTEGSASGTMGTTLDDVPAAVAAAIRQAGREPAAGSMVVSDESSHSHWLLRPFPRIPGPSGYFLVDLGTVAAIELGAVRQRVDRLLDDAIATLERLDIETTVAEAEYRRQSASLRDAVIGSTSHGLRTPLASIMGSASILAAAEPVAQDPRLASLARIIVSETERLNGDIQKMLDAAMLSAAGVKPQPVLIEPSDLINAAVEAKRREMVGHRVSLDLGDDLPFVHADPQLAREALGLLLDNAARYSEPGTNISISARREGNMVAIAVDDEGLGLDEAERLRLFEKFYRGARVRDTTRGSGLGLWIASSFIGACEGRISIAPRATQPGTCVTIQLPAATEDEMRLPGGQDD
ncbi:MAG: DUF4118 domain-containing protein [Hyphomicrobiaceae bacterium]|nr:DUF4118 domain-containing protein [Hyphomicrobiaceae bacterium]